MYYLLKIKLDLESDSKTVKYSKRVITRLRDGEPSGQGREQRRADPVGPGWASDSPPVLGPQASDASRLWGFEGVARKPFQGFEIQKNSS